MASHAQLRRAIRDARRNDEWRVDHTADRLVRAFPRMTRSVEIDWDVHRRRIRRVIEGSDGPARNVSIRRAITLLRATFDEAGNIVP